MTLSDLRDWSAEAQTWARLIRDEPTHPDTDARRMRLRALLLAIEAAARAARGQM